MARRQSQIAEPVCTKYRKLEKEVGLKKEVYVYGNIKDDFEWTACNQGSVLLRE